RAVKLAIGSRRAAATAMAIAGCLVGVATAGVAPAAAHVLRVGKFNGSGGGYATIASAVAKAEPGDWILIGPGDYKEAGTTVPAGAKGDDRAGAAVPRTKPGVHIRGSNR